MFLEASLDLAFRRTTADVVRVPPPSAIGRLLHRLTLGQTGEQWEREAWDPAQMLGALAVALREAGLTDLISAAVDDEIIYRDDRERDGDLDPVLQKIAERSEELVRLELVAQLRDDVGTYLVQLTADRLHPVERLPLRIRVHALLRAFDVRTLPAGVDVTDALEKKMIEAIRGGLTTVAGPLQARLLDLCRTLEERIRARIDTYPTQEVILCCAIRPRLRTRWEQTRPLHGPDALPVLRAYPGMPEAAFYLQLWLPVLTQLEAQIRRTLVLDGSGQPVLHIGHEPAKLGTTKAYLPGESIAEPPGALDVAYFSGHDYEAELRERGRLMPHEGKSGDAMWKQIRERELGVMPEVPRAQEGGPSAGTNIFDTLLWVDVSNN